MKTIFLQIVFLSVLSVGLYAAKPVKGVWLTNVASEAMFSKEGLRQVVDNCEKYGINTIYTVTWNRGYTLYPSDVMERHFGVRIDPKFEGRDPLQELIDLAHPKGIKVVAWFEFGFSYSYKNEGGNFIIEKYPHWAAIGPDGKVVEKNGFYWMNGFDREVQDFIIDLVAECVRKYDIDGIQGDDRLPALPSLAGYDAKTIKKYTDEHGGNAPSENIKDEQWVQWRADQLTDFMGRLVKTVKGIDKKCILSFSPSIYPWCKYEYLQDWPTWVKRGYVEELIPQVYRYDTDAYARTLKENVLDHLTKKQKKILFPGVLLKVDDYVATKEYLDAVVRENRKNGLKGEVFFFYEGIPLRTDFFKTYK